MNKNDYLEKILSLCTQKQKDFFSKIYPDGIDKKQINMAIFKVENTLRRSNSEVKNLKISIQKLKEKNEDLSKTIKRQEIIITRLENELYEAHKQIKRLENPINIKNSKVQERLELLDALERGGVDNWDHYDDSIEDFKNEEFNKRRN